MKDGPEIQEWNPEWLVVRGNYMTLITPELAAELLERNRNNRQKKTGAIRNYARDMAGGKWNADASDIKFDRKGDLLDGQNRLMACIQSGTSFPTLVRTGIASSAKDHVDQGVRRTIGDTFKMAGVTNANVVGAAVSLRQRYEKIMAAGKAVTSGEIRVPLTHQEAIDYLSKHPSVEKVGNHLGVSMYQFGPGITKSVWVAFVSMAAEASEEAAQQFGELWIEGKSSGTGDPLLALSRYVALAKAPQTMKVKDRMANEKNLLALVKVWNAWRMDEKMDKLSVREGEQLVPCV